MSLNRPAGRSAEKHIRQLFQLILGAKVTDIRGTELSLDDGVQKAADVIVSVRSDRNKIMIIGNGGSAAIASHAHNDLCKRAGIRALVFNEAPLLTALANDYGYASVFERPLEMWAEQGDLLLAISSSGRSESILRAAQVALKRRCRVITLSGFASDNPLHSMGHINFYIASSEYGEVETAHSVIMHFLTDLAIIEIPED